MAKSGVPYIQILDMVADIYFNEISIIVSVCVHNEAIGVTSYFSMSSYNIYEGFFKMWWYALKLVS